MAEAAALRMDSGSEKFFALKKANAKIALLESKIRELHGSLTYAEDMWGKDREKIHRLTRQLDDFRFPWPSDSRSFVSGFTSHERRDLLNYLGTAIDWKRESTKRPSPPVSSDGTTGTQQGDMVEELRRYLYRALYSPTLPDSSGEIAQMLRSAPTAWHIRTVVGVAVHVLIAHASREDRETASMRCLGEIVRLFQTGLKLQAKRSPRMREALEHPAYLEALNRPPAKRTRGGTGGNDSIQVVATWTQATWKEFDKQYNRNFDPLIYNDTETYVLKFMEFAKESYERDNERFDWAEMMTGMKARTNTNEPDGKPKQSFSLFKDQIEKNVRLILGGWQKSYAPVWVFKDKPNTEP